MQSPGSLYGTGRESRARLQLYTQMRADSYHLYNVHRTTHASIDPTHCRPWPWVDQAHTERPKSRQKSVLYITVYGVSSALCVWFFL